jgi:hypothetical protein
MVPVRTALIVVGVLLELTGVTLLTLDVLAEPFKTAAERADVQRS